jgi:hypothetical protein
MNWNVCGTKRSLPNLMNYFGIVLEGLRKTIKNLSQDRRSSGRDFNAGPPKYKARVLTTLSRRSVYTV